MKRGGINRGFLGSRKAVSALIATVLLLLITFSAVGVIWGAVLPMLTTVMKSGQACLNARVNINSIAGFTCYDENKKQINVMVNRGPEEFNLSGVQISLISQGKTNAYTVKKDINLIKNGSFESWSAGPGSAPDGWVFAVAGGGTIARSANGKIGAYASAITRGTNYADLYQDFHTDKGISYWRGRNASLSCWVKTSTANSGAVRLKDDAGVTTAMHSGSGLWENLKVTRTINSGATYASARCDVNVNSDTILCDGCMLVEGSEAIIWGENIVYGDIPEKNEARTYTIAAENITGVSVAPIVQVGRQENTCGITSRFNNVPKCVT